MNYERARQLAPGLRDRDRTSECFMRPQQNEVYQSCDKDGEEIGAAILCLCLQASRNMMTMITVHTKESINWWGQAKRCVLNSKTIAAHILCVISGDLV